MSDRALSLPAPTSTPSNCMWVPVMGALWLLANVGLGGAGIYLDRPVPFAFAAGLINGTLLGVIAVATASARFQAGATGLLGGLSLSGLRADGSMIWKAMQGLHDFIDNTFRAMGFEINEKLHHTIEQESIYMIWTMVFVVMASLVAEWVQSARRQA